MTVDPLCLSGGDAMHSRAQCTEEALGVRLGEALSGMACWPLSLLGRSFRRVCARPYIPQGFALARHPHLILKKDGSRIFLSVAAKALQHTPRKSRPLNRRRRVVEAVNKLYAALHDRKPNKRVVASKAPRSAQISRGCGN